MHDTNSVAFLFDLYRRHKLGMAAKSTVYQYELNLRRFAEFLGRDPQLADLQDEVVSQVCGWMIRQRQPRLSAGSASKFRDCVVAAWRFGARKKIVEHWPDVPEVREPRRIPVAWTRQELATLWAYISRMPGEIAGIPQSDWFCSLHAALWDSGERIGALMQTEWPQVDLAGGWLIVRAENRKGGLSDKLSKLHPQTVALLERIRLPERKLVWEWPFNRFYLWQHYGDILKRAGLPNGRERKFHCLRKSCSTHITALSSDAAAQAALGHSDIKITREIYNDPKQIPGVFPSDILPRLDDEEGMADVCAAI